MIQITTHVPHTCHTRATYATRVRHAWYIRATTVCSKYADVCIKKPIRAACVYIRAAHIGSTYAAQCHICRTYVDICWRSGPNVRCGNGDALLRTPRACPDTRAARGFRIDSVPQVPAATSASTGTWVPCLHAYGHIRATYADVCKCTGLHTCRIRTHTCHFCNTHARVEAGLEAHMNTYVLHT